MKKIVLILLAGAALMSNSCTKTGPTGPQGPTGNANVIGHNKTFTVSNWTYSSANHYYTATFSDPDITSSIVSSGIVEIFKYYSGDGTWTNLPDINGITSTVFNFYEGGFDIYIQNMDGSVPNPPGTITFRDVIISSTYRQAHPNTNWANYNEATAALSSPTTTTAPAVTQ